MKFSKTEIIDGQEIVTLFATGRNTTEKTVSMLEEMIINTEDCPEVSGPAKSARDLLNLLMSRVKHPKVRSKRSVTPETVESQPVMALAGNNLATLGFREEVQ